MFFSAILLTCWAVGETAVPAVIGLAVDEAIGPSDVGRLRLWLIVLGAAFLAQSYGFRNGTRLSWFAMNRQEHRLRGEIVRTTLDPARRTTGRLPGEIASLASSDADAATGVLRQASMGAASVLGLVLCAGYLLWADLWVGVAVLVVTPLSMGVLRLLTPHLSRTSHRQQEGIAAAGASAADVMQGVEVLRGIGGEYRAGRWYTRHSQNAARAGIASAGASGRLEGAQVLVSGVVLLVAAGLGAWRVVEGDMTVGTLGGVLGVTTFFAGPWAMSSPSARATHARPLRPGALPDTSAPPPRQRPSRLPARSRRTQPALPSALPSRTAPWWTAGQDVSLHWAVQTRPFTGGSSTPSPVRQARCCSTGWTPAPSIRASCPTSRGSPRTHPTCSPARSSVTSPGRKVAHFLRHCCVPAASMNSSTSSPTAPGTRSTAPGRTSPVRNSSASSWHGPWPVPHRSRVLVDPTTAVDSVTEARIAEGLRELRAGERQGTLVVVTTSSTLLAVADEVVLVGDGALRRATHAELLADDSYRAVVSR